jgi:LPXTG-site transpeptidase (sortase) family protein
MTDKTKQKKLTRSQLSKLLIIAGALCLIALLGYELATYPWGARGRNDQPLHYTQNLPDPTLAPGTGMATMDMLRPARPTPSPTPTSFNTNALFQPRGFSVTRLSTGSSSGINPNVENVGIGFLKIGRLDMSEMIYYGATNLQLRAGVGYMPETSLPDEKGNMVLTGHRTSSSGSAVFRYLPSVQIGDYITVTFFGLNYNYQVFDIIVVNARDVWVLDADPDEEYMLTLLTCEPLVWIGHRPNRWIVRARLIDITEVEGYY